MTTGSEATAVPKVPGQREVLGHLGSAHSDDKAAALVAVGWQKIGAIIGTQQVFDLGLDSDQVMVPVTADKKVGVSDAGGYDSSLLSPIRIQRPVADEAFSRWSHCPNMF